MKLNRYACWHQYRRGYFEIMSLIDSAKITSNVPDLRSRTSPRQTLLKAAVLLLCSNVESFFRNLVEEYADELEEKWSQLSPGFKRYVILNAREYVLSKLSQEQFLTCSAEHEVTELHDVFREINQWLDMPKTLCSSPQRTKLEYFYRGTAPKAIEKVLNSMRHDGHSFFGWVQKKGLDRSRFWTVLDVLVEERNGISHEAAAPSLTIQDVRLYVAIATSIVRQALLFVDR